MFKTTILYRDAMSHESSSINIPGLIARNIESSAKQAQQVKAVQANFGTEKVPPLSSMQIAMNNNNSYVDPNQFVVGDQWQWQQPINNPLIDQSKYKQQYPWDQDQFKKYGPAPRGNSVFDEQELLRQLGMLKKQKSAFEELIDQLFTTPEKEQLLIDMGYILEQDEKGQTKIMRKLSDGTMKTITNSLDDLFLKEITVKFKNLLLAKATLKIKI